MASPTAYASFLVRMWRECDPERSEVVSDWHGEVEHIQSGQRYTFRTLDETLSFLRRQADVLEVSGQSVDDCSPARGQGENHLET